MKKIISLMLSAVMLLSLTACGETEQKAAEAEITDNNEETALEQELTYPLTIKVGYSTNESDPRGVALASFKEAVEKETNGQILVEIHANAELGSDAELIAGMITGEVDMTVSSAGNYAAYATRVGVSALPFLFSDFETAWEFMDSDIISSVNEDLEAYNMHVLAHFDNGFRCVTTKESVGPIEKVSDMEGLVIRTPENQIVMETMSQLKASPKSYPFGQLKEALKDGTFGAQENPIPIIYNNAFYEVQKYLSVTNHSYDAMPLTIRCDIWKNLKEEYRDIIAKAAKAAEKENRQIVKQQTEDYVALLEEEGMVVVYPDLDEFKEATAGVMDVFTSLYGEQLLESIRNQTAE